MPARISLLVLLCCATSACSSPRELPEPSGPLIAANPQVPADYHGDGLLPIVGGVDEQH